VRLPHERGRLGIMDCLAGLRTYGRNTKSLLVIASQAFNDQPSAY